MLPVALLLACGGSGASDGFSEEGLPEQRLTPLADPTACSANGGAGPFRVYMSTTGNDANSGRASTAPVLTLARVQDIIRAAAPTCNTEVRIGLGTYYGQQVNWTYVSGYQIKFMPEDGTNAARPVFDGCSSATGSCTLATWFILSNSAGVPSKLHFWYIRVQRYSTAISFNGNRDNLAGSNGGNRIFGCYFDRIGNGWSGSSSHPPSTAAVRLVNSDDNIIENNHFYNITNSTSPTLLHAVYVAHKSDRNSILRNFFKNVSGDAIRVRDYSNYNIINQNRISRAGSYGYSEWFCDSARRTDCTLATECRSYQNEFRDNTLDGTYSCLPMSTWVYYQTDYPLNCTRPQLDPRLRTSGNVQTATPCSL
jgi:hypothetical protein